MGLKTEDMLSERVRNQISILNKGETSQWIDGGKLKLKFWVQKVLPSTVSPLNPDLRKAIRQRMMVDRGRIKNDVAAWMDDMRKKVKLDLQGSPFDSEIKALFKGGM